MPSALVLAPCDPSHFSRHPLCHLPRGHGPWFSGPTVSLCKSISAKTVRVRPLQVCCVDRLDVRCVTIRPPKQCLYLYNSSPMRWSAGPAYVVKSPLRSPLLVQAGLDSRLGDGVWLWLVMKQTLVLRLVMKRTLVVMGMVRHGAGAGGLLAQYSQ